jgi:hypothetical protein
VKLYECIRSSGVIRKNWKMICMLNVVCKLEIYNLLPITSTYCWFETQALFYLYNKRDLPCTSSGKNIFSSYTRLESLEDFLVFFSEIENPTFVSFVLRTLAFSSSLRFRKEKTFVTVPSIKPLLMELIQGLKW